MKVRVLVRLKSGVLDVQGKAVEHAIVDLGHNDVHDVRIGKLIELSVDATSFEAAREKVTGLCQQVFTNPIIENFEIISAE